jgi:hypothetical protein
LSATKVQQNPMPKHGPSLADAYLKTTRAKLHLEALRSELDAFRNSNPCWVFRNENHKLGRYEIRVKTEDTPDHIPLILGDLLYCLRSSLDQLTWSLARLTTEYPRSTQFPIFDALNAKTRKRFAEIYAWRSAAGGEVDRIASAVPQG